MDVASREEVEVLRDLVAALRSQNEALAARVAALEGASAPKAAAPKPADPKPAKARGPAADA